MLRGAGVLQFEFIVNVQIVLNHVYIDSQGCLDQISDEMTVGFLRLAFEPRISA